MTVETVLAAGFGTLSTILSALYLQAHKSKNDAAAELAKWRAEIDKKVGILDTKVSPLWSQVQLRLSNDLHQPHPRYAEMDTLLERLDSLVITPPERDRLKELLKERAADHHPDITDGQRSSALLMLGVMDKVLEESRRGTT
jgi:hypothetical protein